MRCPRPRACNAIAAFGIVVVQALAACGPREPLTYAALLTTRLTSEVPDAKVVTEGRILRASLGARTVDVDIGEIENACRRGQRDCEYAIGRLVLQLRGGNS